MIQLGIRNKMLLKLTYIKILTIPPQSQQLYFTNLKLSKTPISLNQKFRLNIQEKKGM